MTDASTSNSNAHSTALKPTDHANYKALTIDYALYDEFLKDPDLSEDQRREFLDILWNIIVNFVDIGFGIHPLQQVLDNKETQSACVQNAIPPEILIPDSSDVLELGTASKPESVAAAVREYIGEHTPESERTEP